MKNLLVVVVVSFISIFLYKNSSDTNQKINKVNVFITMGQSNSVGKNSDNNYTYKKSIFMPLEYVAEYPSKLTFSKINTIKINKGETHEYSHRNSATEFAKLYDKQEDLYIIQIARDSQGLSNTRGYKYDNWALNREDNDGLSLHPQSLHYLTVFFNQLKEEGKEPHVIGLDWNQWEAEKPFEEPIFYFLQYKELFESLENVIPNKDFKLFICNPTSNFYRTKEEIRIAFKMFASERENTFIYKPDNMGINDIFEEDKRHYKPEVVTKISKFIFDEINK